MDIRKTIISFLNKNDKTNIKENIDDTIRCSKCNAPYTI